MKFLLTIIGTYIGFGYGGFLGAVSGFLISLFIANKLNEKSSAFFSNRDSGCIVGFIILAVLFNIKSFFLFLLVLGFLFIYSVIYLFNILFSSKYDADDEARRNSGNRRGPAPSLDDDMPELNEKRESLFLAIMSAMMAKIAKADGRVSNSEIAKAEQIFRRLGLSPKQREYCIEQFRKAKSDAYSIFSYAHTYANRESDSDMREILYDIIWEIASADGTIAEIELKILRELPQCLNIRQTLFFYEYAKRVRRWNQGNAGAYNRSSGRNDGYYQSKEPQTSALDEAYATIGVSPNATDDDVKKAYREKAKKNHPDILVNKGVPREKANEQMARINAAWAEIKKARDL